MKVIITILLMLVLTTFIVIQDRSFDNAQDKNENEIFIFNWKSNSFVPSFYQGKALPTAASEIEVSVELIRNGLLVNLNSREISWFVNNKLVSKGRGLQKTTFTLTNGERGDIAVRVLGRTFVILIVRQELIIESANQRIFHAWPFFFNVKKMADILFNWRANNQEALGDVNNPNRLELDVPEEIKGMSVVLSATAQNRLNLLEFAKKTINLLIR